MFLHFVVETEGFKKINKRFRRRPNSAKGSHRKIYEFDFVNSLFLFPNLLILTCVKGDLQKAKQVLDIYIYSKNMKK